jgi:gas vesicle protein
MSYEDERAAFSFVTGLALGALVGAGVALLMAPQSGRRTRKQIARTAEDWGETAGERLQDATEEVRKVAEDALKVAERSGGRLRDGVRRGGRASRN